VTRLALPVRPRRLRRAFVSSVVALLAGASLAGPAQAVRPAPPRPVKVMIVTLFGPEAAPWLARLAITRSVRVPGLSDQYPEV